MRISATILLFASLALGAVMSEQTAVADEPKKEDEKYPIKVTLRVWDKQSKQFLNPYKDMPAKFIDDDKGTRFVLKGGTVVTAQATNGSEIIEADGKTVWVVTKASNGRFCDVKKKP